MGLFVGRYRETKSTWYTGDARRDRAIHPSGFPPLAPSHLLCFTVLCCYVASCIEKVQRRLDDVSHPCIQTSCESTGFCFAHLYLPSFRVHNSGGREKKKKSSQRWEKKKAMEKKKKEFIFRRQQFDIIDQIVYCLHHLRSKSAIFEGDVV